MAYTFFRALGGKTGSSLCEEDKLDLAIQILEKAKTKGVSIHLPVDSVIADQFSNEAAHRVAPSDDIPDGWMGLDIGPKAAAGFADVIAGSKTILWNGPMGVFEIPACAKGTFAIAQAVASNSKAVSIIGGGDSVTAIKQAGVGEKVTFISTGGGASLEFLEGKVLPGVAVLQDAK